MTLAKFALVIGEDRFRVELFDALFADGHQRVELDVENVVVGGFAALRGANRLEAVDGGVREHRTLPEDSLLLKNREIKVR